MRLIHLIAIAAAAASCYGPEFPAGVRCSLDRQCPGDQICAFDDRCYDPDDVPEPNVDATLSSLEVSRGTLVPAFDPAVTSYILDLGIGAEDIVITATASAAAGADIVVEGSLVESGVPSAPVALGFGDNTIAVELSANSGESLTYELAVNRGAGIAQQAYIKASNAENGDRLGGSSDDGSGGIVVLSGDTLAVSALSEDSSATGVNGDQSNNSEEASGAVYVFVRDGANWSQQAYIKASNTDSSDRFGASLALSDDTLAVGAPFEDSSATDVDGDQDDNTAGGAGAVYVFTRSGTIWTQQAYLKASNTEAGDEFGAALALDGDTLAVGAPFEASSATGIAGNQSSNTAEGAGAVYVFTRSGGSWSQQAYIKASNTDSGDSFGRCVALSGDTLAAAAPGEASSATGINNNQADNSAPDAGAVYMFTRNGTSWSQQAYIKSSNTDSGDFFGGPFFDVGTDIAISLALSGDTLAVGAFGEDSSATGVDGDQTNNNANTAGAIYVFSREGATWLQEAYLKASNTDSADEFGLSLSLDGDILVASSRDEDSGASGIDGDQGDNSASSAGAVYIFSRTGTTWTQRSYIKASNTEREDRFGAGVAISNGTIAVVAPSEDSNSVGVNGDELNNSGGESGAAYVFD
jgi:hypothetical protein